MKIWRFGQIKYKEHLAAYYDQNKITMFWLKPEINYKKINIQELSGLTCIEPWVNEATEGDLVFLISKDYYAGIAVIKDGYRYKKYDFSMPNSIMPGIPVDFIHKLKIPVEHNFNIIHTNPRTFSKINQLGFELNKVLGFLKSKYSNEYSIVLDYINNGNFEENKISRICWNIYDWQKPSGPSGKNISEETFEGKNRFGYEEWLNVKDRKIEKFHYAFLQTLGSAIHYNKIYNVSLIVNDNKGRHYLVGHIKNVFCISDEESKSIYQIYKNKGWLKEMSNQLESVGGDCNKFLQQKPEYLFNIKFEPANLKIYNNFYEIKKNTISTYRYKLLDGIIEDFNLMEKLDDEPNEGAYRSTKKIKRIINTEVVFDPTHSKMQNNLKKLLKRKRRIYRSVHIEQGRVDIKAKTLDGKWHFYEIKTCSTCKKSVRQALGQVMEYAFWPSLKKADELIIVSENDVTDEIKKYMLFLRENFNLPVYYQSFKLPWYLGEKV